MQVLCVCVCVCVCMCECVCISPQDAAGARAPASETASQLVSNRLMVRVTCDV